MTQLLDAQALEAIRSFWDDEVGIRDWIVMDIYEALARRFVGSFQIEDAAALRRAPGRPRLFVANHETAVESPIFLYLMGGVLGRPLTSLAKKEHRNTWIGNLSAMAACYPGANWPNPMEMIDRENQRNALAALRQLMRSMMQAGRSALVHVEGTRARVDGQPVRTVSSALITLAIDQGIELVPVRFTNGLPQADAGRRFEFPYRLGQQDIWVGRALTPESLEALSMPERKRRVLERINGLGTPGREAVPDATGAEWLGRQMEKRAHEYGVTREWAVILQCLEVLPRKGAQASAFLDYVKRGEAQDWGANRTWFERLYRRVSAAAMEGSLETGLTG